MRLIAFLHSHDVKLTPTSLPQLCRLSMIQDNIRALMSTLHTVLWEDSGWKTPGLTDLVETGKVRTLH